VSLRRNVRVADLVTGQGEGVLTALGLGSCVAIVLWDAATKSGGMAHVLLPSPPPRIAGLHVPARYAQSAVPALLDAVLLLGASRRTITARIAGGASMFTNLIAPGLIHTGERNVLATREALHTHAIPMTGEWVGGDFGRTVVFDLSTGKVTASSVRRGVREL
jgi:chemotaxis protein CheD